MADLTNSSKLSVARRTSQCHRISGGPLVLALRSLCFLLAIFHKELLLC